MLLGCCHCEGVKYPPSESSESDPPSLSSSGSSESTSLSSSVEVDYECGACIDNISPVRFKLTYSPDAGIICPGTGIGLAVHDPYLSVALYTGDFTLKHRGGCFWTTDEKAIRYITDGIPYILDHKRFSLSISSSGGSVTIYVTVAFKHIEFSNDGGGNIDCSVGYGGANPTIPDLIAYSVVIPGTEIDCLSARTLNIDSLSYAHLRPRSIGFGGAELDLTGSNFPATLTIGPG